MDGYLVEKNLAVFKREIRTTDFVERELYSAVTQIQYLIETGEL